MTPPSLTQTAAKALADIQALLTSRFTGTIILEVHEGGVRELRWTVSVRGDDLGKQGSPKDR